MSTIPSYIMQQQKHQLNTGLNEFPHLLNLAKTSYSISIVVDTAFLKALGFPIESTSSSLPSPSLSPPLSPLLSPALPQITTTLDYSKNELNSQAGYVNTTYVQNSPPFVTTPEPSPQPVLKQTFTDRELTMDNLSKLGFPLNNQYRTFEPISDKLDSLKRKDKHQESARTASTTSVTRTMSILRNRQSTAFSYVPRQMYVFKKVRFLDL